MSSPLHNQALEDPSQVVATGSVNIHLCPLLTMLCVCVTLDNTKAQASIMETIQGYTAPPKC